MKEQGVAEDPYRRVAGIYDRIFEPVNRNLRLMGLRMFVPRRGAAILDVGCGTGAHLALYQRYAGRLAGVDASVAMLKQARLRLGREADLRLADAATLCREAVEIGDDAPPVGALVVEDLRRG